MDKVNGDFPVQIIKENRIGETIDLSTLPLYKIRKVAPEEGRMIRDAIFNKAKLKNGLYQCTNIKCGKKSPHKGLFQIDHIIPLSKGGKTIIENLQLLCCSCNRMKSDHI